MTFDILPILTWLSLNTALLSDVVLPIELSNDRRRFLGSVAQRPEKTWSLLIHGQRDDRVGGHLYCAVSRLVDPSMLLVEEGTDVIESTWTISACRRNTSSRHAVITPTAESRLCERRLPFSSSLVLVLFCDCVWAQRFVSFSLSLFYSFSLIPFCWKI